MRFIFVLIAACVAVGCDRAASDAPAVRKLLPGDAPRILDGADSLIVYSLDPDVMAEGEPRFHGYVIRSTRTVDDRDLKRRVAAAVFAGVAEGGARAACFDPRHGVRATRGGASVDLVICFECSQVRGYPPGAQTSAAISDAAKAVLDGVLASPATRQARDGAEGG
jgi:hypothetical protein